MTAVYTLEGAGFPEHPESIFYYAEKWGQLFFFFATVIKKLIKLHGEKSGAEMQMIPFSFKVKQIKSRSVTDSCLFLFD